MTAAETRFLDASQALADDEIAREAALAETRRRLERRSRRWLLTAVAALLIGSASAALGLLSPGEEHTPRVGWVYHRTGYIDRFFEVGLDRAADENRFALAKAEIDATSAESAADRFAAQGEDLVIVTTNDTDLVPVARRHRDVDFLMFTGVVDEPNVTSIGFAHQDGAFLVGAAAALASTSGTVGFIGGADTPELHRIEAGFVAGVRAVTPDARVLSTYLSRVPDYDGFFDQLEARRTTREMVRAGADVIFPAAGGAQYGALDEVAVLSTQLDRKIWGIGVDDDVYANGDWMTRAENREHVLTSMVVRFDVAIYDGLRAWLDGTLSPGRREYDLSNGGIELTRSGGFLTPYAARLEQLRQDVVSGRTNVPCVPKDLAGPPALDAAAGPGCR
ncbi:BMP family lipoprotein [Kribbella swartbergensis]